MGDLLTPDDVAALLRVKRWRVLALARGEGLPSVKMGRDRRFRLEDVEAWIARKADETSQRDGFGVPGSRTKEAVGRDAHRGLGPRGKADPKGPLRIDSRRSPDVAA